MPLAAFCLRHFSADFIICTCECEFRQAQVPSNGLWRVTKCRSGPASWSSALGECTADSWPAHYCSAPSRTTCSDVHGLAAETVACGVRWAAGTESASERDDNTSRMHLRRVQP